jgi:peptidoglycan hydrolase-like protein with peptidoglycan-binding domain
MPITKSVGKNAWNVKKDVRYVQTLLNYWREHNNRPAIKVDGVCGPKTIAAIEDFQKARTGLVDGRVDPGGPTIRALDQEFEKFTCLLKGYATLALVLSYDPEYEVALLNNQVLRNMLCSITEGSA